MRFKLFVFLFFFVISCFNLFSQGYKIEIQIKQLADSNVYLGYHYGNEQFVIDTAHLSKLGKGVFEGKKELPQGVYMVVLPNMTYFDILVPIPQKFFIKNDTLDLNANLEVIGSPENEVYVKYQKFSADKRFEISKLSDQIKAKPQFAITNQNKIDSIQFVIRNERSRIIKSNPKTFFAALLNSMVDPDLPAKFLKADNPAIVEEKLNYLALHYFDNYDFNDENLLFSPVLFNKLMTYYSKLIINIPDSINKASDLLLVKSMKSPEVYRFILNTLISTFDLSGDLPNDEAFVYLADNYYLNELAPWVNEEFLGRLRTHITDLRPTLVGSVAPALSLSDTLGNLKSIKEINACFTLVLFWNPDCEHCIDFMAELNKICKIYPSTYFQVYTVLATDNEKLWRSFLRKNSFPWISVFDSTKKNEFIDTYKLFMIPRMYLLDSEKRIVRKDFEAEELQQYLQNQFAKGCK